MRTSFEKFTEVFDNLTDLQKICLWNGLGEDIEVHLMSLIDSVLGSFTATEIIIMLTRKFDIRHEFFFLTGGRIYSIECLSEFLTEGRVKAIYDKFVEEGSLEEWIEANSPEGTEEDEE